MSFNALAYQREIENMFVKPLPPSIPLIPIEPKESRNELRDLRETLAAKKIEAPISDTNRTEQEPKKGIVSRSKLDKTIEVISKAQAPELIEIDQMTKRRYRLIRKMLVDFIRQYRSEFQLKINHFQTMR